MQKTIYICDNCKKELKDNEHLSFNFNGSNNGFVRIENGKEEFTGEEHAGWNFYVSIPKGGFYQFCDFKCMEKYFNKIKEAKQLEKLKE